MATQQTIKIMFEGETRKLEQSLTKVKSKISGIGTASQKAAANSNKAFKQVEGRLGRLKKAFSSTTAKAVLFGGAILLAGAGLFKFWQSTTDVIDRQAKLARQLNTTVGFIQQLGFAAELSGTNLEVAAKSITKLQIAAQEAIDGTETYTSAFNALGISAAKFAQLDAETQFNTIAEALRNVEDSQVRLKIGTDLMGKGYRDLIPLLSASKAEFDEMTASIRTLTVEQAAAVESANDAWAKVRAQMSTTSQLIVAKMAPAVEALAENFNGLADGIILGAVVAFRLFTNAIRTALSVITTGLANLSGALASFYETLALLPGTIGDVYDNTAKKARKFQIIMKQMSEENIRSVKSLSELVDFDLGRTGRVSKDSQLSAVSGTNKTLAERNKDAKDAVTSAKKVSSDTIVAIDKEAVRRASIIQKIGKQRSVTNRLTVAMKKGVKVFLATKKAIELENQVRADGITLENGFTEAFIQGSMERQRAINIELDSLRQYETTSIAAHNKLKNFWDTLNDSAGRSANLVINAYQGMENAFVKFVRTGKFEFRDLANSIVDDLARIVFQQTTSGLFGAATGVSGGQTGATGGGIIDSIISGVGSLLGIGGGQHDGSSSGAFGTFSASGAKRTLATGTGSFETSLEQANRSRLQKEEALAKQTSFFTKAISTIGNVATNVIGTVVKAGSGILNTVISIGSSLLGSIGGGIGSVVSSIGSFFGFADGGIVNKATPFKFAGGAGIMGEAGPEAIMPLRRGRDGKLGVAANGNGGGGIVNNFTVNVTTTGNATNGRKIAEEINRALETKINQVIFKNQSMNRGNVTRNFR